MWREVVEFVGSAEFVDLLLPGWLDREGPVAIHRALLFDAYLDARNGLVHFASVNNRGGLRVRLADAIDFGVVRDEGDEPAIASIGAHFLSGSGPLRCSGMRLFVNNESSPDHGVFRAVEMTFEGALTVFFDPFWPDGLRLGTGNVAERWLEEDRSERWEDLFGPLQIIHWPSAEVQPG